MKFDPRPSNNEADTPPLIPRQSFFFTHNSKRDSIRCTVAQRPPEPSDRYDVLHKKSAVLA